MASHGRIYVGELAEVYEFFIKQRNAAWLLITNGKAEQGRAEGEKKKKKNNSYKSNVLQVNFKRSEPLNCVMWYHVCIKYVKIPSRDSEIIPCFFSHIDLGPSFRSSNFVTRRQVMSSKRRMGSTFPCLSCTKRWWFITFTWKFYLLCQPVPL